MYKLRLIPDTTTTGIPSFNDSVGDEIRQTRDENADSEHCEQLDAI